MFASGSGVRRSSGTQAARTTTPPPISNSVRGSSHPHSFAREMANSGGARPSASTAAPRTSTRPRLRTGDSGTSSLVSTAEITAMAAPSQKIQ